MMEMQIEEIYRILLNGCNGIDCIECEGKGKKDGCLHYHNANAIYNAGYRKASEVAEEIFAKIEEMLEIQEMIVCETRERSINTDEPMLSFVAMLDGRIYSLRVVDERIAELKKKYTESEDTE